MLDLTMKTISGQFFTVIDYCLKKDCSGDYFIIRDDLPDTVPIQDTFCIFGTREVQIMDPNIEIEEI